MKKLIVVFVFSVLCCLYGCKAEDSVADSTNAESDNSTVSMPGGEGADVYEANRSIIAHALNIDENERCLRFILNCLNTIDVGQLQEAELVTENGEKALVVVAAKKTNYQVYLTQGNSVEAVKDLDTGEWLVQSDR